VNSQQDPAGRWCNAFHEPLELSCLRTIGRDGMVVAVAVTVAVDADVEDRESTDDCCAAFTCGAFTALKREIWDMICLESWRIIVALLVCDDGARWMD